MIITPELSQALLNDGYTTVESIYNEAEVARILQVIEQADADRATFRKSADLFAIRQFLKEVPDTIPFIFNENLQALISTLLGDHFFVVKSIYFDKPASSNWYVAYHQDLTISVDKRVDLADYGPWTTKQNQFAVQPPLHVLENICTLRIHLDDTDENNGALRVVPGSHAKQIL